VSSRRAFIVAAASSVAAACAPALHLPGRRKYDLVIRGGTVFDGSGADGIEADVAIKSGRIAAVGPMLVGSRRDEFDARGLAVAPGFVDIHSHGDESLFADPRAESVIRQGITTIVVGQDGASNAPADRPLTGITRSALGMNGRSRLPTTSAP